MDQQQEPRWQPTRRQILWAGATVGLLTIAILIGYCYGITLWDWIEILIVPAVIAGGGLWFNRQQRERELDIAREQRESDVAIADERTKTDREIADQRAQDDALQAYLNHIGELLLDKDRPLRQSKEGDEVRTLARARTLTVLTRLKGGRKGSVVRFLYESGLITKDSLILDLRSADLSYANLRGAQLNYANLREADLSGANLSEADLSYANLFQAGLSGANLSEAVLREAKLSFANLRDVNLRDANLRDADLVRAILRCADLSYADLSYDADLKGADLSGAHLRGTNLSEVDLSGADLSKAYLVGTRLRAANLSGTNLSGAEGFTNEEIEQQAASLEDATMPNGQKYEDWLKSRDREENGKNGGSS